MVKSFIGIKIIEERHYLNKGVTRMSNGVLVLIICYRRSQIIRVNNIKTGSWNVIDYRLIYTYG